MNKYLVILIIFIASISCQNQEKDSKKKRSASRQEIKENLIKVNKHLLKYEDQSINDFISRYNYNMKETGSGLFYEIYEKGHGEAAVKGKIAVLNFSIRLLNGQVIYRSEQEGIKEFKIGKGGVESGLEEGILLLHVGDKARFIIPSHLAFGLLGNLEKIPEKATIIYDMELLNLK